MCWEQSSCIFGLNRMDKLQLPCRKWVNLNKFVFANRSKDLTPNCYFLSVLAIYYFLFVQGSFPDKTHFIKACDYYLIVQKCLHWDLFSLHMYLNTFAIVIGIRIYILPHNFFLLIKNGWNAKNIFFWSYHIKDLKFNFSLSIRRD